MRKVFPKILGILIAFSIIPVQALAVQSGGGYTVYDQVVPIKGISSGGSFNSTSSGHPIGQKVTGGGYIFTSGIFNLGTTSSSGGGGGGGGGGSGGGGGGTITISPEERRKILKFADFNHDNVVDLEDLSILLYHYQHTELGIEPYDLNSDGVIDITDISVMLYYWEITS